MSGLKESLTVTLEKNEGLERIFKAIISAKYVSQKIQENLKSLAASIQMPGFRPGRVPTDLVERRYGSQILSEVLEETVNEACNELIKDQKIRPALQPNVKVESFEKEKDLVVSVSTEVLPEINLIDFGTLTFEKLVADPTDKQIQEQIELEATKSSNVIDITDTKIPAQDGDFVFGKTSATLDNADFRALKNNEAVLYLDATRSNADIFTNVKGMKIGESKTFKVTLDEKIADKAHNGKIVDYTFTLEKIKRLEKKDINDALAEEFGFDSLSSWKEETKLYLNDRYAKIAREIMKHDLLHKLEENHQMELPKSLIELEYQAVIKEILKERGIETKEHTHVHDDGTVCDADHNHHQASANHNEDLHKEAKLSDEDQKKYRDLARKRVKVGLILAEVSLAKEVKISDAELRRALNRLATQYPGNEKKIIEFYTQNPEALNRLRAPLLEEKVVDYILAMAKISDKNISYELLMKAQEDADNHC